MSISKIITKLGDIELALGLNKNLEAIIETYEEKAKEFIKGYVEKFDSAINQVRMTNARLERLTDLYAKKMEKEITEKEINIYKSLHPEEKLETKNLEFKDYNGERLKNKNGKVIQQEIIQKIKDVKGPDETYQRNKIRDDNRIKDTSILKSGLEKLENAAKSLTTLAGEHGLSLNPTKVLEGLKGKGITDLRHLTPDKITELAKDKAKAVAISVRDKELKNNPQLKEKLDANATNNSKLREFNEEMKNGLEKGFEKDEISDHLQRHVSGKIGKFTRDGRKNIFGPDRHNQKILNTFLNGLKKGGSRKTKKRQRKTLNKRRRNLRSRRK
jgi:hypothetical protein